MASDRFDKQDTQTYKLQEDVKEIKTDLADVRIKIDYIYGVLDTHMKRIEDILIDNKTRDHRQDRMERWIFRLADKLKIKLNAKLKYE